jgi:hypothetical protein
MSSESEEVVVITLVKTREGVDPERFAEFVSTMDLPTWRRKDVVIGFNTYRVAAHDESSVDADFVEVMHLRSWAEWEDVGNHDPEIAPLAATFTELADESQVQRIFLTPVEET